MVSAASRASGTHGAHGGETGMEGAASRKGGSSWTTVSGTAGFSKTIPITRSRSRNANARTTSRAMTGSATPGSFRTNAAALRVQANRSMAAGAYSGDSIQVRTTAASKRSRGKRLGHHQWEVKIPSTQSPARHASNSARSRNRSEEHTSELQ